MANTITYSHKGAESPISAIATGLITSDGDACNVICGFHPTKIELWNYTPTNPDLTWWAKGMTEGTSFFLNGADGVVTKLTDGFTMYTAAEAGTTDAGDQPAGLGFTIDADLLTNADTLVFVAYR